MAENLQVGELLQNFFQPGQPRFIHQTVHTADAGTDVDGHRQTGRLRRRKKVVHPGIIHAHIGGDLAHAFAAFVAVIFEHIFQIGIGIVHHIARIHIAERHKAVGVAAADFHNFIIALAAVIAVGRNHRQNDGFFHADAVIILQHPLRSRIRLLAVTRPRAGGKKDQMRVYINKHFICNLLIYKL